MHAGVCVLFLLLLCVYVRERVVHFMNKLYVIFMFSFSFIIANSVLLFLLCRDRGATGDRVAAQVYFSDLNTWIRNLTQKPIW